MACFAASTGELGLASPIEGVGGLKLALEAAGMWRAQVPEESNIVPEEERC